MSVLSIIVAPQDIDFQLPITQFLKRVRGGFQAFLSVQPRSKLVETCGYANQRTRAGREDKEAQAGNDPATDLARR